MRTTAIATLLALSIALTSGCVYQSARRTAKIGAGLLAAGVVAGAFTLAVGLNDTCDLPGAQTIDGCELFVFYGIHQLILSGAVVGTVGLTGMTIFENPATADARARDAVVRRRAAEQEAAARAAQKAEEDLAARDPECLPRRIERLRAAGKIVDAHSRGLALLSIPVCITASTSDLEPPSLLAPVQP